MTRQAETPTTITTARSRVAEAEAALQRADPLPGSDAWLRLRRALGEAEAALRRALWAEEEA